MTKLSFSTVSIRNPGFSAIVVFLLAWFLLSPSAAFAISYLPGQTLDPACTPSDATCIVVSAAATSTTAGYFVATSTTATSTFAGNITVSGNASSTNTTISNTLTIGSLTGILKTVAGVVTTALVNLSNDVTGILGISNGGTGTSTAPTYGQVLVGNGSGGYALTATSSLGLLGPTSLSASAPLSYNSATGAFSVTQSGTATNGYLSFTDFTTFNNKISSTSLSAGAGIAYNSTSGVITNLIGYEFPNHATSTNLTFSSGLTVSGGSLTLGASLNGPLQANGGVVSATSSVGVLYGGTGLTMAPSYGQLLLGNASSGYSLTATSSLGITSSQWTTNNPNIYYLTGNVGIGTTSPLQALSVQGNGLFSGNIMGANITATGTLAANTLTLTNPLSVASGGTGITNFIPPNAINILSYGVSTSSTDNATGLQSAINAAVAAGVPLYIPAASSTCYKYTAPLTISGNLSVVGDYVVGNWSAGINVPLGTPPLAGSVLCPSSNGSDAIDIVGTSLQVNISNVGILFQTVLAGTGDGIHYFPSGTNQGLTNAYWQNVMVYGHDGNHYAFNIQNPIYGTFVQVVSFGGGGWNLMGSGGSLNFGNMTFIQPYVQVIVGGSANGFTITASSSQKLNLLTFVRPQAIVNNISGVSPAGNLPTSAQSIWSMDANVRNVRTISPDFETNVGSSFSTGASGVGNDLDWNSLFTDAATINAPAWTTGGIMYGPQTRTFNDTTSSGTGSNTGMFAFPGTHVTASNAVTYPVLSTLYVSPPILGSNASASRLAAIYATAEIYTTGDLGSNSGLFVTGTTQINHNSGSVTQISDGTASGAVTIGGANNKVGIGTSTSYSKLTVWGTDSAATTSAFSVVNNASTTVFSVFDNGNATYSGSIFQSSDQRLKTNVLSLDASSSLAAINGLNPVSYNRIDQDTGPNLGFIAQQVQQIFPDLVSTTSPTQLTPDGTLTLNYVGLIAPLVKAVQAISQQLASLENTVAGFAQSFVSDKVTTKQLCVEKSDGSTVCASGDQLASLLAGNNQPVNSSSDSRQQSAPAATTSPTPPVIQTTEASTTTASTTTPTPDSSPAAASSTDTTTASSTPAQ
jgi:hypothetical protein